MAITQWAPFGAFASLEREMQALERELQALLGHRPADTAWRPDLDVYREGGDLVVRAELPGIDPVESLEIEIDNNVLRIRGHKRVEREIDEEHRYIRECRFGSFERDLPLPGGVDPEQVSAVYENGILLIRVPAPVEVMEGTRVPIRVEERKKPASQISPD